MYNTVSELNIERFENYHDEYEKLSGVKKNKVWKLSWWIWKVIRC